MNAESTLAAVRALSEGRAKIHPLKTIPVQTLVLTARPMPELPPLEAPEEEKSWGGRGQTLGQLTLMEAIELYRATNPGEFTAKQAAEAMKAKGWDGGMNSITNVCTKLRSLTFKNYVREARREGVKVIWQFV